MFKKSSNQVKKSVYGVWSRTKRAKVTNHINGTGFKISDNILATCAHVMHQDGDVKKPLHKEFLAIRAPDIGKPATIVKFIAEDPLRDVALLEIHDKAPILNLDTKLEPMGTTCGSLGFPLCTVKKRGNKTVFDLTLRFQGAHISGNYSHKIKGAPYRWYETDSLMYQGSSGCPGFRKDGVVWGMHSRIRVDPKLKKKGETSRLAISIWLSSLDIIDFAKKNGLTM